MNILTFDIEEWYIYWKAFPEEESNYLPRLESYLQRILDMLDEKGYKATFFCLGKVAREFPEVIKAIVSRGHEVGCHSDRHEWLTNFSQQEFEMDTRKAIDSIQQASGEKVRCYRAPAFSVGERNKWVLEVLHANGIECDCSIFPAVHSIGGFSSFGQHVPTLVQYNGIVLKEFPIGTTQLLGKHIAYSGGGYFRLLPYFFIKRMCRQNPDYVMTYFHLRDFDRDQKKLWSKRYFNDYYGTGHCFEKFARFMDDFEFVNLQQAENMIDWNQVAVIQL